MSTLAQRLDWAPERLAELLERYGIPGGTVAVWHDGEEYAFAAGMANLAAGIAATPDALFLIGSITKVYTTTLIMQLVERGEVDLDAPVRRYVPELRLADPEATETVTVRHLLTHTSGITGDYFPDFGRGDDAVARCVASLSQVPMLHRPGALFSYCNSGFILAGRLIERVTGQTWDAVLHERLLAPLGSERFATLPEEALLYRVGVAHVPDPVSGALRPGQMWPEVRSGGPAGFTPWATATDVVRFARLHLDGGVTTAGERILAAESVAAMQARHVDATPSGGFDADGWGLGWARYRYGEREPVVGHNGGSSALLRVLPERNFAVASLTNAAGGAAVGHHLIDAIVDELFGLRIPTAPEPPTWSGDLAAYEGAYRHHTWVYTVAAAGDALRVTAGEAAEPLATLRPLDGTTFVVESPHTDVRAKAAFLETGGDGRPRYLHFGGRARLRVE